jgi:hypothetical protein
MKKTLSLLLFLACPLFAHDLYLRGNPLILSSPGDSTISMVLAEAFPGEPIPWRADKTSLFKVIGPTGGRLLSAAGKAADPVVNFSTEGTYVLAWTSTPSYIKIESSEFNPYLEEEGYRKAIELRKQLHQESMPGKEKYTRYLKAFVQVGVKQSDQYKEVFGFPIELIPLSNPYSLHSGSSMKVRLLFQGKPLANHRIMATYDSFSKEHDVYAQTATTGSNGEAEIQVNKPGLWMIRSNEMLPLEGDTEADWQSFWANFTFHVIEGENR